MCSACSFCGWHVHDPMIPDGLRQNADPAAVPIEAPAAGQRPAGQKNVVTRVLGPDQGDLAQGVTPGTGLARAMDVGVALLAGLHECRAAT